jgi:hypothetical protein
MVIGPPPGNSTGRERHALDRPLPARWLERGDGAQIDRVSDPLVHLRLVEERLPVGEIEHARPSIDGRRGNEYGDPAYCTKTASGNSSTTTA